MKRRGKGKRKFPSEDLIRSCCVLSPSSAEGQGLGSLVIPTHREPRCFLSIAVRLLPALIAFAFWNRFPDLWCPFQALHTCFFFRLLFLVFHTLLFICLSLILPFRLLFRRMLSSFTHVYLLAFQLGT